ncbi:MAG: PDZ domain-containing protein [Gemmatimonadota bacterium]
MIARIPAFVIAAALWGVTATLGAQSTRLLRQPDVSATSVVFSYGGDLWLVSRDGGDARRLTSSPTLELDPVFSPDGKSIAFTGGYDGNPDVYVIAADGGTPRRLTWHPGGDAVRGWTPDGKNVVFMSGRVGPPDGQPKLWTVPLAGGLPTALPVPRALTGSISPDGSQIAYAMVRPWESEMRRYRGGQNQPIRLIDVRSHATQKLPWTDSRDQQPVWLGSTIYFISDRDWTDNVWSYDSRSGALKQITHFSDFEVKSVRAGGGVVAYEQGGNIHLYDPSTSQDRILNIRASGDFPWAMRHPADVSTNLVNPQLSPTGVRALFEARGDILTVPTDKGTWRDLTPSSASAERTPIWSPDGKQVAWFSDAGGEYQLMVGGQDGIAAPRAYPLDKPSYYYSPAWSPDGTKILFGDANMFLSILDLASGKQTRVAQDNFSWTDREMSPSWSPDSRWISYTKRLPRSQFHAVFVYDVTTGTSQQLTDGLSDAVNPTWDRSGKYLIFLASTNFALNTGWLDMSSIDHPVERGVYLAVLAKHDPSPLLPESGDEPSGNVAARKPGKADSTAAVNVTVDADGFMQRIISLNVPSRDYTNLRAGVAGQWFYLERVPHHADILHRYDLKERKAMDFVGAAAEEFAVSFDGKKLLYQGAAPDGKPSGRWAVVDATGAVPDASKGTLATSELKIDVDPVAEWRQIFNEAWRIERDYLYVSNMNGADWPALKAKYSALLPFVRHRDDLNRILDEMQGELTIGHSFVGGGDLPTVDALPTGLLGADLEVSNGRYRIAKIYTGENWNPELRAPLSAPGVDVRAGDYILAVNGQNLTSAENPYAPFVGTVGKQVQLLMSRRPTGDSGRLVTVVPIANEGALRTRQWIESNRRKVDSLSGGQLAYVYVPNTTNEGYIDFNRYYFAQQDKKGAVIDERFNHGGQIADYLVDVLARKLQGYFNMRVGDNPAFFTTPGAGIWGPKVLLINEASGSGGDAFPYLFRQMKVGPLIGTRTWGGLVGWGGEPPLVDGGFISAPSIGFYDLNGKWAVENEGVAPDIEVEQSAADELADRDTQLERAVVEALRLLKEHPVELKPVPPAPDRVHPPRRTGGA